MSDSGVFHFELSNGLKLLCRANRANPTVGIQLSLAAGTVDDPRGRDGLANFARALLTKGTKNRSTAWIAEKIDSLGLDLGFSTGRHTIGMNARVLKDNLKPALKLIAEILSRPQPPADEAERLRERILTAIKRNQDDPAFVAVERLGRLIFGPSHPYAKTTNGAAKTVKALNLEEIQAFYHRHFLPAAALAVIVGDIEPGALESLAEVTLGAWKGGGEFRLVPPKNVKLPGEPKSSEITMPGKAQSDVALGFPCIKRLDPAYYALLVGNIVLGRLSLGGRIGRRVRDKEGLAYYAYTGFDAGVGAGPFLFRAGVNPAHVRRAVEAALEEMRRAKTEGITAEEMEDAVVYLSGGMARQVETNGGMASTLLSQEIFGLGDDHYLRYESILRGLTLADVNAALAAHLHPDNYCLAVAGPVIT
jgi:zinc protease